MAETIIGKTGIKRCPKCKTIKVLDDFYKKASGTSGLTSRCKACLRVDMRERWHQIDKLDPQKRARRDEYSRKWHAENRELHRATNTAARKRTRLACLEHYGKVCACCGEHRYEFLAIDHVNGGGVNIGRKRAATRIDGSFVMAFLPDSGSCVITAIRHSDITDGVRMSARELKAPDAFFV